MAIYTAFVMQMPVFTEETTNGHLCFLYKSADERLRLVAKYLKQGVVKNELCIFVTYGSQEDVMQNFAALDFDAASAVSKGSLQIYEMNETYMPNGHFVADYMLNNVGSFIEEAKAKGFTGLRTAGEMGWLADHPEAVSEAISYEHKVNGLNSPRISFIGLCLYPAQELYGNIHTGAMHTHPTLMQDNEIITNPFFQSATV